MGRLFKFDDPKELERSLDAYFANTDEKEWTVTGLCLELECDRDTLLNYEKEAKEREEKGVNPEIVRLIKKAKMRVHNAYERDLRGKGRSGDIFALKNFGWRDEQRLDHTTGGEKMQVNVISYAPPEKSE